MCLRPSKETQHTLRVELEASQLLHSLLSGKIDFHLFPTKFVKAELD